MASIGLVGDRRVDMWSNERWNRFYGCYDDSVKSTDFILI